MKEFLLHRRQWLPRPVGEVFAFFADAANLEAITPPWLNFRILPPPPAAMASGTRIRYRLRWRGVPIGWLTEIRVWHPPNEFVDEQVHGPYRLWHHTHRFRPADCGTLMTDTVRYALPLGPLGLVAHACLVKSDLQAIFDFRSGKVAGLMGEACGRG